MRRTAALIATVGLLTALSACSATTAQADCTGGYAPGAVSATIDATGDFGTKPDVTTPTPLNARTSQTSTPIAGEGLQAEAGSVISMEYSLIDGATGTQLQASSYDGSDGLTFVAGAPGGGLPGLAQGVLCATPGSRIAVVIAPQDGFGDSAQELGLSADTSLLLIADIESVTLARANGAQQIPQNNVPTVTLDKDGVPGVAQPDGSAPTELQQAVLKKGDGAVVADGDTVVVNYTGWNWETGDIVESTWRDGSPVPLTAAAADAVSSPANAIVGATVGSQIEIVLPAALADPSSGTVPAGTTVTYVIDILGVL